MVNLDDNVTLLHNYIYKSIDKSCFDIDKIDIKNIKLENIKITENKENFFNDLKKKAKFQFLNFNKNKNLLILKRFSDSHTINLNISPYKNNKHASIINKKNNKDSLFSYILSKLVLEGKTNNILVPIFNIDVSLDQIKPLIKNHESYKYYKTLIDDNKNIDLFSIQIKENFFDSNILKNYIMENEISLKSLLFQVIHTLYVIKKEYPDFKHNFLSLDNILVYLDNINNLKKYKFHEKIFNLDDNFIIKIFNFRKASSKIILNEDINSKDDDLLFFINELTNLKEVNLDSETKEFIKFIKSEKKQKLENLLNNKYFNSLEILKEKKNSKQKYMKNKNDNFNISLSSKNNYILGNQDIYVSDKKKSYNKLKRTEKNKSQKGGNYVEKKNNPYLTNDEKIIKYNKRTEKIGSFDPSITNDQIETTEKRKLEKYKEKKRDKLLGGNYQEKRNDPYVSKDEKDVKYKRALEKPNFEPKLIARQEVYDTSKPPPKKQEHIPVSIPAQHPFLQPIMPYQTQQREVHVVRPTNINFSNPISGSHSHISKIYESMIPNMEKFSMTLKSVKERNYMINYIRDLVLTDGDGEELSITAGKHRTLLSWIQLIKDNPYRSDVNPYKNLPKGFLMYSSAYPVRFKKETYNLELAATASSINARIYDLSIGATRCGKINKNIDFDNFDVWREIKYYQFIREDIIKKKVSPNFVALYMYTLDSDSKINYQELDLVRNKYTHKSKDNYVIKNAEVINNEHLLNPLNILMGDIFGKMVANGFAYNAMNNSVIEKLDNDFKILKANMGRNKYLVLKAQYKNREIDDEELNYLQNELPNFPGANFDEDKKGENMWVWTKLGAEYFNSKGIFDTDKRLKQGNDCENTELIIIINKLGKVNISLSSGQSLVALTEGPNSNITKWSSHVFKNFGTVQTQIQTGFHINEVWKSVLFQLLYACMVLYKEGICFENFSLENNVYIKDLKVNSENRDHWVYNLNGLDYYVPNYGYLVMIDTNYSDIKNTSYEIQPHLFSDRINPLDLTKYKINSEKLYSNKNNIRNISDKLLEQFHNLFDSDNFSNKNFETYTQTSPDSEIIELLNNISPMFKDIKNSEELQSNEGNLDDIIKKVENQIDLKNEENKTELEKLTKEIEDHKNIIKNLVTSTIEKNFTKYFGEYLHNRIGKSLSKDERDMLVDIHNSNFKKGELVAYQERYEEFKWAIYLNKDNIKVKIIKNDNGNEESVFPQSLYKFSPSETVKQTNEKGINYDSYFTIEKYRLDL